MNMNNIESYKYRGIRDFADKKFRMNNRYEWLYGYLVIREAYHDDGTPEYYPSITRQVPHPLYENGILDLSFVNKNTVTKCSGGKDIDGKYVYSGDLVRLVSGGENGSLSDEVYVFDDMINSNKDGIILSCAVFPTHYLKYTPADESIKTYYRVKVVGNIFENKDLAGDRYVDLYSWYDEKEKVDANESK